MSSWIDPNTLPEEILLVTPKRTWTAQDLRVEARELRQARPGREQVSICFDAHAAIVELEAWQGHANRVTLLHPDSAGTAFTATSKMEVESKADTRWILMTSGTTGTPKLIAHTQRSLTRTVRRTSRTRELVWGLLYPPSRMAGLQVVAQALGSGARLVAPDLSWTLAVQVEFLATHKVNALSTTPTLWRQILQTPASDELRLSQVTLGGEIADQRVLDALSARFPNARITHVFAATESGAAFAVTDRRAGFPVEYLQQSPYGIELAVVDGVLTVHAPDVEGADSEGFVSTGDLVEVDGDRVQFLGRQSGAVNIGGAKVMPEQVEQVLRDHRDVCDARVYARDNPFTGSILIAEVVTTPGVGGDLGMELRAWVRDRAPSHHVPARVLIVEDLQTTGAGKVLRT